METTIYTTAQPTNVTAIYEFVKPYFNNKVVPTIHNLVWQTVVNRLDEDKRHTFDNIYTDEGKHVIARVFDGEGGYYDTKVEFLDSITYEKAREIIKYLNKTIFGQSPRESMEMINKAMHNI